MAIPSMQTLTSRLKIDGPTARIIRGVLDSTLDPCEVSPAARALEAEEHPLRWLLKLEAVNELLGGSGVEYIPHGRNQKSPAIHYVNMGDTYATTILRVGHTRYRVGCWGDIVERGNYE